MKNRIKSLLLLAAITVSLTTYAQKSADPQGALTYCLPSTTITLEVTALQECFYAGPYAKFAEKYFGVKAKSENSSSFRITDIKLIPSVEADLNARYSIMLEKGKIDASFLKLSSSGLVSFADASADRPTQWRFPVSVSGDFAGIGVMSNITSKDTELFMSDKKSASNKKVSVQQSMTVTKTLEQRAEEAANMILKLRQQRLQIVTGDTDATYSGEAMGAAIEELTRLEEEYMTLFFGYSETHTQKKNFDIIPEAERETQKYRAFRISDTSGLLPADNLSGKPVFIEFIPQEIKKIEEPVDVKKKPSVLAYYRIPAVCTVKLYEGADVLLQTRVSVYQLGVEASLPVNVIMK